MSIKKKSKKKIRDYEKLVRRIPASPASTVYMDMYHSLQVLHLQGEYELVIALCNAAITNM